MHDIGLIHTDLKPENILFVSPEYVKVPDYKVAVLMDFLTFTINFCFFSSFSVDISQTTLLLTFFSDF